MVDDESGNGAFSGDEFQAKLVLEGGEEGGAGVFGLAVILAGSGGAVRGPGEVEVVAGGEVGLVDDCAMEAAGEKVDQGAEWR